MGDQGTGDGGAQRLVKAKSNHCPLALRVPCERLTYTCCSSISFDADWASAWHHIHNPIASIHIEYHVEGTGVRARSGTSIADPTSINVSTASISHGGGISTAAAQGSCRCSRQRGRYISWHGGTWCGGLSMTSCRPLRLCQRKRIEQKNNRCDVHLVIGNKDRSRVSRSL
jgi:hypothetical protein